VIPEAREWLAWFRVGTVSRSQSERTAVNSLRPVLATLLALILAVDASAQTKLSEIKEELLALKELCDQGALEAKECDEQRKAMLAELAKNRRAEKAVWFCNYAGDPDEGSQLQGTAFSESAPASTAVHEILDAIGISKNFVVRAAGVPNAMASVRMGERFIEYNPSFVKHLRSGSGTNWSIYSVLAHEIGHHLEGHTLKPGGSRPPLELEADEFSGHILAKMGASLEQAQVAMRTLGSDTSRGTHPATDQRLAAIEKGWQGAQDASGPGEEKEVVEPTPSPSPPPSPSQYSDLCAINGVTVLIRTDGSVVSPSQGGVTVGRRTPSTDPRCAFSIFFQSGANHLAGVDHCVLGTNGYVYVGNPFPVGQCRRCSPQTPCN
jgi:hypothetical protein